MPAARCALYPIDHRRLLSKGLDYGWTRFLSSDLDLQRLQRWHGHVDEW